MTSKKVAILDQFGSALRRRRLELNLTQEALASLVGIDRTYISGLERGLRNPTLLVLARLASSLDIPVAALLEQLGK